MEATGGGMFLVRARWQDPLPQHSCFVVAGVTASIRRPRKVLYFSDFFPITHAQPAPRHAVITAPQLTHLSRQVAYHTLCLGLS